MKLDRTTLYRQNVAGYPEPSRITINRWVSDRTNARIPELVPQGIIDLLTETVLTNATALSGQHLFQ